MVKLIDEINWKVFIELSEILNPICDLSRNDN